VSAPIVLGRRAAILTVSDGVFHGTREDGSGQALADALSAAGLEIIHRMVVADETDQIASALRKLAESAELVVTTGGTGLGPRDVTPEATMSVIERSAPGLAELIRIDGRTKTPMASLSRGVVGVLGNCLIVNMPGSPKGATESLDAVMPVLGHALQLISGHTQHDQGPALHDRPSGDLAANGAGGPAGHSHSHDQPPSAAPMTEAPQAEGSRPAWDIAGALADRVERGEPSVLATAIQIIGAPPCTVGQKLLLGPGGPLAGTLGCSDFDDAAIAEIAEILQSGLPVRRTYTHDLGSVEVYLEPYRRGPRLVVVAATPVALWLLRWGRDLGYYPVLVESRPEWITPEHRQAAGRVVGSPDDLSPDPESYVVHTDHDAPQVAEQVGELIAGGAKFVGIIGSARHTGHHLEGLRKQGVPEEQIARVQSPVGLNLGSKTPPEIALSILAGLLRFRTGRPGEWLDPSFGQNGRGAGAPAGAAAKEQTQRSGGTK
jgi:molybdopterin adenylyltransferase